MKTLLTALLLASISASFAEEASPDPFEEGAVATKGSKPFIPDEILRALEEPRLDKGTGRDDLAVIRVTIIRAHHRPLVFIFYPRFETQAPALVVKRARMQPDDNGIRSYPGLDINKRMELSEAQNRVLKTLFEASEFDLRPALGWQTHDFLDGSSWIYERAVGDSWTLIHRTNPIDPSDSVLKHSGISTAKLVKEMNLTSFALMLWAMSGIEDSDIY